MSSLYSGSVNLFYLDVDSSTGGLNIGVLLTAFLSKLIKVLWPEAHIMPEPDTG